ncbi:MAG: ATP-binding cassette domain-containing protein [Deltaproteobacteria bacterium]|nr:ATP-binding cassette domain-containing protein [Deltaproteobacteria bacterium]
MLEIHNLMVFYENAIGVNNVTIKCGKAQITGVFGSNAAGKTTLMFTASGIILDTAKKERMRGGMRITVLGEVLFDGQSVVNVEPSDRARKGLVLCPERRRIFKESTVIENLRIGGIIATKSEAKRTLDYVFTLFPALVNLQRREAGFLSGGEQQMLAIGRALMAQPKFLLLDEPLLGLSPAMEEMLIQAVKDINRTMGLSILIAEQYARPVFPIIHYGYVLENGGVVVEGTAEELMANEDVKSAYFGLQDE